ncbi:tetraspanin-31-like [Clytia hemisphaerica]|uniref:Tetraspanin n=1 Tax=Clytia hemisphaerica TaxID=252671 RepID=A0A7M5V100_9CNID|eukprot:TCONS_00003311-protein
MCKGNCYRYKCLNRFLTFFNFLLLVLGITIATLPVYIKSHEIVKSWPINGGIIAMGAFIGLIALVGCYGSRRQNQVILFFYMIVLAIVCVITFAFSLAALSLSKSQQSQVLSKGWDSISPDTRSDIQKWGECCGFLNSTSIDNPSCSKLDCFKTGCPSCQDYLAADWFLHFRRSVGGVSLFVSILMCLSIYLTAKYRHIKNPRANANDYL